MTYKLFVIFPSSLYSAHPQQVSILYRRASATIFFCIPPPNPRVRAVPSPRRGLPRVHAARPLRRRPLCRLVGVVPHDRRPRRGRRRVVADRPRGDFKIALQLFLSLSPPESNIAHIFLTKASLVAVSLFYLGATSYVRFLEILGEFISPHNGFHVGLSNLVGEK